MKCGGVLHTLCVPVGRRHSLCFYIAAVSCAFKFVLHILAHIHTTHVHARVNIHTGVQGLHICALRIREYTHTSTLSKEIGLQRHRVSKSERAVQRRVR